MKLIFFLILFVLNSSFACSMNLYPRSLADINTNKKLLIIGFGNYHDVTDENGDKKFRIYFKKYYNDLEFRDSFLLTPTIDYYNGTKNLKVNISCIVNEVESFSNFECTIENKNKSLYIESIQLNDLNIRNKTYYTMISANEIELSYLAETTKNNIQAQYGTLNLMIFDLIDRKIDKDEILLYGNLETNPIENFTELSWKLYLSENKFECKYYHNYSQNSTSYDAISFSPDKNINDNFNGKIANESNNRYHILIFSNGTDDSILYSTVKSSSADLYGFENYTKYENKSAENVAVFFGTSNILKKYLRFPASVRYGTNSTLRFLEVLSTNATGTILTNSTDIDNGIFKYRIVFPGTEYIKNILGIYYSNDFQFSDDNVSFTREEINTVGDYINLTNTDELEKPVFINFSEGNPTVDENTFSFKFRLKSNNSNINITNKQPIFLNYSSMETSERDEIDSCTIENNTNIFTINCEPKKDIYTLLNSLIIKVPNVTTNRRLRFLQSSGNSTIRAPKTAQGDIQFDYNPEVNTFGRKSSKKKGLSGGAIAAIVLATIAAVVAVGVAIFFLNRGPINPIKTSTEMNLPNSTTNINN